MEYSNGDRYTGHWALGSQNGHGEYWYFFGDRYTGNWRMGNKDGRGQMYYSNGAKYDGNWENDKAHGKGKFKYPNQDTYFFIIVNKKGMTVILINRLNLVGASIIFMMGLFMMGLLNMTSEITTAKW